MIKLRKNTRGLKYKRLSSTFSIPQNNETGNTNILEICFFKVCPISAGCNIIAKLECLFYSVQNSYWESKRLRKNKQTKKPTEIHTLEIFIEFPKDIKFKVVSVETHNRKFKVFLLSTKWMIITVYTRIASLNMKA